MDIADVTFGYSAKGAQEYYEYLNAQAIGETKNKLGDIQDVETVIAASWVGPAQEQYIKALKNDILTIQNALDELDKTLQSQLEEIVEDIYTQDQAMVQELMES